LAKGRPQLDPSRTDLQKRAIEPDLSKHFDDLQYYNALSRKALEASQDRKQSKS